MTVTNKDKREQALRYANSLRGYVEAVRIDLEGDVFINDGSIDEVLSLLDDACDSLSQITAYHF